MLRSLSVLILYTLGCFACTNGSESGHGGPDVDRDQLVEGDSIAIEDTSAFFRTIKGFMEEHPIEEEFFCYYVRFYEEGKELRFEIGKDIFPPIIEVVDTAEVEELELGDLDRSGPKGKINRDRDTSEIPDHPLSSSSSPVAKDTFTRKELRKYPDQKPEPPYFLLSADSMTTLFGERIYFTTPLDRDSLGKRYYSGLDFEATLDMIARRRKEEQGMGIAVPGVSHEYRVLGDSVERV